MGRDHSFSCQLAQIRECLTQACRSDTVLYMSWNNRIVKTEAHGNEYYVVAEVFYNDAGEPHGYAPMEDLSGESPEDIKSFVSLIYHDVVDRDMPVLDAKDI